MMTDFQKYIQRYLDLIPSDEWLLEMQRIGDKTIELYQTLSEEEGQFAYTEGKWSLKVLLEHLTDTETIFQYRALRFSRGDASALLGFDEEFYAQNGIAQDLSLEQLIQSFAVTREKSLVFFEGLKEKQLMKLGIANGNEINVKTIGQLIVGHNIHHLNIIEERYLPLIK